MSPTRFFVVMPVRIARVSRSLILLDLISLDGKISYDYIKGFC